MMHTILRNIFYLYKAFNRVPITISIVWLEVNVFGQTILPELISSFSIFLCFLYFMWRIILWKLMLKTKINIQEMENI